MTAPDTLCIRSDRPEDLARVYAWLDEAGRAAGLPITVLQRMHVALEEVVMNAVMHGFGPGEAGDIRIALRRTAEAAELVMEDPGRAFDPTMAPAADPAGPRREIRIGGMGLTLLRHFCPRVAYERVDGLNRLTLGFPLTVG